MESSKSLKRYGFFIVSGLVFFLRVSFCFGVENWGQRKAISYEQLQESFADPDMIYGPFAFWFWDTELDVGHASRMAEEMVKQRLNPGYAHPRRGLPSEQWLSPLWFESFGAAVEKAEAGNAYLGYCDELWWPSGRADGRVLAANPELKPESLKWEVMEVEGGRTVDVKKGYFAVAAEMADEANGYIRIKSDTLQVIAHEAAVKWEVPTGRWRIYIFSKYSHPGIDGGDVNYINRKLMDVFIGIAHRPYAENMGEKLGKSVPGVFVDNEGDYGYKLAWSDDLDKEYKQKNGRDIRVWMPLLVDEDVEGKWAKARWDWFETVSDIYCESFLGRTSDWLAQRGMYCISNLWEETLFTQAQAVGDFFKAQRSVTMPGNDCLMEKALQIHDFKETQSVTEFENRRFQSEILGVAGWQMSPVLMKRAVNSVIAWGGSHIVPHGINLNRRLNKIPYSPDWFESNPYWRYLHLWTDYTRRASYVNSQGNTAADVLLVNPMDSIWALLGDSYFDMETSGERSSVNCRHDNSIKQIESVYSDAIKKLTDERVEYLIADRYYIRQMEVKQDGGLVRGVFEFKAVVLPSMLVLPLDVAEKIVAFAENGGAVYILGDLPSGSTDNGMADEKMTALMERLVAQRSVKKVSGGVRELVADPSSVVKAHVRFESGEFDLTSLHRRVDGRDFFWLVNNTDKHHQSRLFFTGSKGLAGVWDCENGKICEIGSHEKSKGSVAELSFEPYEAFWVVFDPKLSAKAGEGKVRVGGEIARRIEGDWTVRIDTTIQPVAAAPKLMAPEDLLGSEGQDKPLENWSNWDLKRFTGYVDYTKSFDFSKTADRVFLDLGDVKFMAELWVNGAPAGVRLWPPFRFDVTGYLRDGKNQIRVRVGNTLINAMSQYYVARDVEHPIWGWVSRNSVDFNAGLLGPVVIEVQR